MAPEHCLVLTASPKVAILSDRTILALRHAPDLAPPVISAPVWLGEGEACELALSASNPHALDESCARVQRLLSGQPIDVNPAPLAGRRKRLLVADMESTIIGEELIDEIADYVGLGPEIAEITARAMQGELPFEPALRERVAKFAGLDARVLDEVYEKRVTLMPGATTLVRTMKGSGAYTALVSGGFSIFAERIARRLGFDEVQANVLEIVDGRLTGRVREPVLGRSAKRRALETIAAARGLSLRETLAVGDGANDLDMLAAAGLGVAYHAKAKVQEAARALPNGAVINHGDLTALLYLQGYRSDQFAAAPE
jgi:phosphoserine phosphatase